MSKQQELSKKEVLKNMEAAMAAYTSMYWAFKNAEYEKEIQIKDLNAKINALTKEIEKEDKKKVEGAAKA